ncbi:MAG: 2-phospho-L-lactate guanylyltransferase [Chloroflexi bacterium]|nr:MAG: 2-phospho-L-lactate guanylyltransferase [Chloroflexota bacterium]
MVVIIPAKPFAQAKSRLSAVLSDSRRAGLSRSLLARTVRLARQVGPVAVISRDPAARRLAKELDAWALVETGTDLNAALRQAVAWALARGHDTALILPADLPRLAAADLQALVRQAGPAPAAVIAPCRREDGTNALLLRPPDVVPVLFGPGSFARHCEALKKAGIEPVVFRAPGFAFDLDTPDDWDFWRQTTPAVGETEPYPPHPRSRAKTP